MNLIEREIGLDIELKENTVAIIVIEQIDIRLPLVNGLYVQTMGKEGTWLLVENEKNYEINKKIDMILEPFSLDLNNKKVKNKLYLDLKNISQDYYYEWGLELNSKICNYIETLIEKMPYPIKYNEEWDIAEIFKSYNVELVEDYDSICEKLFNYIKLMNVVCGINIFIIVNIKQYLTEEQIKELYKFAMYSKLQLVLVEFNMINEKLPSEDIYIIDKDGCIISY